MRSVRVARVRRSKRVACMILRWFLLLLLCRLLRLMCVIVQRHQYRLHSQHNRKNCKTWISVIISSIRLGTPRLSRIESGCSASLLIDSEWL